MFYRILNGQQNVQSVCSSVMFANGGGQKSHTHHFPHPTPPLPPPSTQLHQSLRGFCKIEKNLVAQLCILDLICILYASEGTIWPLIFDFIWGRAPRLPPYFRVTSTTPQPHPLFTKSGYSPSFKIQAPTQISWGKIWNLSLSYHPPNPPPSPTQTSKSYEGNLDFCPLLRPPSLPQTAKSCACHWCVVPTCS